MPNLKSAAKRMKSDLRKHLANQDALSELHSLHKKLVVQVKTNPEQAKTDARELVSKLDKAASQGIIPDGRANRKKARIGKLLNKKS